MPNLMQPTEAQFLSQVKQLAGALGYRTYHPLWALGSDTGWPDLVLLRVIPPRLIFAELKVRAPVTAAQQEWLGDLQKVGQEAYIWRWSDNILQEIADLLRAS